MNSISTVILLVRKMNPTGRFPKEDLQGGHLLPNNITEETDINSIIMKENLRGSWH